MKISVTTKTVGFALLQQGKLLTMVFSALLLLCLQAHAQNTIRIKGRILNDNGQPVPKATVTVKGTGNGTQSDDNGDFEITAAPRSVLVISSVGFANKEINVGNQTSLDITLNTSKSALDEVIVVGYGTQRKRDVTGSVVSVTGDALREVPAPNVVSQLQGRAAGVDIVRNNSRPGTGGQIRIRGNRSLGTSQSNDDLRNQPLLVLDGIPFSGSINDINPDDVSNVEVLKDASATAIYGSRGSNGVILITTKRGKTGKSLISYNAYYGITKETNEFPVFNGQEYVQYKEAARLGAPSQTNPYPLTQAENAGVANGTSTDWQDLIYRKGYVTNHELSINGGTDATQFSLGGGYFKEEGIIPGQDFKRFSVRVTVDHRVNSRIKVGMNTINTISYQNGEGLNPVGNLLRYSPLVAPYNADGTLNLLPLLGSSDPTIINPLTIVGNDEAIKNQRRRIRTFNSLYGEVQLLKGLKYRVNVGLDFRQDQTGDYRGPNTLYNSGGVVLTTTPITLGTALNNANESLSNAEGWTYVVENLLVYEKTIKDKHRLTFTGLYSVQKDHSQGSSFTAQGVPSNSIQDYNFTLASSNLAASTNGNTFGERGLLSYMGRVNYAYNGRYLLTATVRRDGSSVLSEGSQWFTFPAVALGWNISSEDFMKTVGWVSNLKLRAGWGKTANQGIDAYSTLGTLATNYYNYGTINAIGYFVPNVPNKSLKWESTSNWNAGIDFALFRNRLTGTIDVYNQKTSDILLNKSLPRSTGTSGTVVNAGKTKGHGLEITLSSINVETKSGFRWSTDLNFSTSREEIVELQDPALKADLGNGWFVGQPLTVIYDVKKIGIWQTKDAALATTYGQRPGQIRVEDVDNNGKIDAADRQVLGNYQPDWIGGITNRFEYKNFDLSVVIFARMGQTVVLPYLTADGGANGYSFFNNSRVNSLRRDYWTPTNPTDAFPQPDASSDGFIYSSTLGYRDGSFIKCRSINFGYSLPSRLLTKAGISSARIYVTAQNPFIIYSPLVRDKLALDPEGNGYGGTVSSNASGDTPVQNRAISVNVSSPPTRQFIIGLNLKF